MRVVKLKKEEWQFFSLLEMEINGGVDCGKEVDGMFGKSVYECDRGVVDEFSFNIFTGEKDGRVNSRSNEYSIIIYDEDLFREMYKRIKTMICKVLVKQPHPMDRPNRIGKVKDLLEDDGRDYYGF